MDLANANWFKSSRSGAAGHCVEASFLPAGGVAIRHSKLPGAGVLRFTNEEWDAFISGAKNGEFDRP